MNITKSLFAAAVLSTFAAVSFAQAPLAPKASNGSAQAATTVSSAAVTTPAPATTGVKKHHRHHLAKKVAANAPAKLATK